MRADELHKFSDGMLNDVRTALHDIASGIRMEYLPRRKWSGLDKRRARVMLQDIDKHLFQRRLMLESRVVCWWKRNTGNDLRTNIKGRDGGPGSAESRIHNHMIIISTDKM
ncbi:hypothetical protein Tco_1483629 [Tanacetum coccineum]